MHRTLLAISVFLFTIIFCLNLRAEEKKSWFKRYFQRDESPRSSTLPPADSLRLEKDTSIMMKAKNLNVLFRSPGNSGRPRQPLSKEDNTAADCLKDQADCFRDSLFALRLDMASEVHACVNFRRGDEFCDQFPVCKEEGQVLHDSFRPEITLYTEQEPNPLKYTPVKCSKNNLPAGSADFRLQTQSYCEPFDYPIDFTIVYAANSTAHIFYCNQIESYKFIDVFDLKDILIAPKLEWVVAVLEQQYKALGLEVPIQWTKDNFDPKALEYRTCVMLQDTDWIRLVVMDGWVDVPNGEGCVEVDGKKICITKVQQFNSTAIPIIGGLPYDGPKPDQCRVSGIIKD